MLRQAGGLLLRLPGTAEVLQHQAGALAQAVSCLQGPLGSAAQQEFTNVAGRCVNSTRSPVAHDLVSDTWTTTSQWKGWELLHK